MAWPGLFTCHFSNFWWNAALKEPKTHISRVCSRWLLWCVKLKRWIFLYRLQQRNWIFGTGFSILDQSVGWIGQYLCIQNQKVVKWYQPGTWLLNSLLLLSREKLRDEAKYFPSRLMAHIAATNRLLTAKTIFPIALLTVCAIIFCFISNLSASCLICIYKHDFVVLESYKHDLLNPEALARLVFLQHAHSGHGVYKMTTKCLLANSLSRLNLGFKPSSFSNQRKVFNVSLLRHLFSSP